MNAEALNSKFGKEVKIWDKRSREDARYPSMIGTLICLTTHEDREVLQLHDVTSQNVITGQRTASYGMSYVNTDNINMIE